ncbi:MAG: WYL domain-containing protein [Bacteroidales bacterium]|nr:WYL domain-containing protein [Bacteroidales bacterium]
MSGKNKKISNYFTDEDTFWNVRPTFDFVQELLSLGETAVVLAPKTLRKEIAKIGKTVWKRNG